MRKYFILVSTLWAFEAVSQSTIKSYEYWFNSNYASVQKQNVAATSLLDLNTLVATTTLPEGLHLFNIRFRDDSARYSPTISQFFYKSPSVGQVNANVNAYQYWFNTDFEGAIFQQVTPTATLNLNSNINTAAVTAGLHLFHLRFRDNLGQWSPVISQFFYKADAPAAGVRIMNAYQYWFDNNYAAAQLQAVTAVASLSINAPVAADHLSNGLHLFHIRFRDDLGNWTTVVSQFFYKAEALPQPETNLVNAYQYWFDNDFAGATSTSVSAASPYQLSAAINSQNLARGLHLLHVRFKDQRGQWSSVISQFVYTQQTDGLVKPNAMEKMQYWFGSDINAAQTKQLTLQPVVQVTEMIDASGLPDGLHLMHLRFADSAGNWSSTISQFFYKSKETGITNNVITGYRYWFNSQGADNIVYHRIQPTNPFYFTTVLDMGCLAAGNNMLQLQFRDSAGQWSAPFSDTINVTPPANKIFRFTGSGNWSNEANWLNNNKPSLDAPSCREIIIDHTPGGRCILDIPQHLLKNAKLTVLPGKILVIPGNINLKENLIPSEPPPTVKQKDNE